MALYSRAMWMGRGNFLFILWISKTIDNKGFAILLKSIISRMMMFMKIIFLYKTVDWKRLKKFSARFVSCLIFKLIFRDRGRKREREGPRETSIAIPLIYALIVD